MLNLHCHETGCGVPEESHFGGYLQGCLQSLIECGSTIQRVKKVKKRARHIAQLEGQS